MLNSSCPVSLLSSYVTKLNATDLKDEIDAQPASSIGVAAVLLAISLFVLFFGAKLVKPSLFLSAFGSMAIGSFLVLDLPLAHSALLSSEATCLVLSIAPLAIGLVAGVASLCLLRLGFALLGAGAGAGLGYTLYVGGLDAIPSPSFGEHDATFYCCLLLGALVGICAMAKLQEGLLKVATSFVGAAGATPATALLLAHFNVHFLDAGPPAGEMLNVSAAGHVTLNRAWASPYVWAQPLFTLALFCLGLYVQCHHEKRDKAKKERESQTALRPATVPLMSP